MASESGSTTTAQPNKLQALFGNSGGNLSGNFTGNAGYGAGGPGVTLPTITQPTQRSLPQLQPLPPAPPPALTPQMQPEPYRPIMGGYGRKVPENTDFQRINAAAQAAASTGSLGQRIKNVQAIQPVYQPSQAQLMAQAINAQYGGGSR